MAADFVETGDVLGGSAADASVRLAAVPDAEALGAVQARCWRSQYADLLPAAALAGLTPAALADSWREAIVRPPTPRHRVLVACSGPTVVGFVAISPAADPDTGPADGELAALLVDPAHQRSGHGSRLLSAAVDALRANGSTGVVSWVPATDRPRQAFLVSAGMVLDGARRSVRDEDDREVTEVRLTAALAER